MASLSFRESLRNSRGNLMPTGPEDAKRPRKHLSDIEAALKASAQ
jgi:hypothetical protein